MARMSMRSDQFSHCQPNAVKTFLPINIYCFVYFLFYLFFVSSITFRRGTSDVLVGVVGFSVEPSDG